MIPSTGAEYLSSAQMAHGTLFHIMYAIDLKLYIRCPLVTIATSIPHRMHLTNLFDT